MIKLPLFYNPRSSHHQRTSKCCKNIQKHQTHGWYLSKDWVPPVTNMTSKNRHYLNYYTPSLQRQWVGFLPLLSRIYVSVYLCYGIMQSLNAFRHRLWNLGTFKIENNTRIEIWAFFCTWRRQKNFRFNNGLNIIQHYPNRSCAVVSQETEEDFMVSKFETAPFVPMAQAFDSMTFHDIPFTSSESVRDILHSYFGE